MSRLPHAPFVPLAGPARTTAPAHASFVPATAANRSAPATPAAPATITPAKPEPAVLTPAADHGSHPAPKLTFERDGDRITRILVHCGCGEVIPLDCRYADPGALSA
ncbi:MAG: hypothetical protein RJA22_2604 [Verrucomicrobiota bacterium]|jgi:hypothetical protein